MMKEMKASQTRIAWLDTMKGILILFVLLSHSHAPSIYVRFFAPFFLTMFFFVSGYTFSTKGSFRIFVMGKIKRLIVPLMTMGGIKLILANIIQGDRISERITGLLLQISGYNDDLWFIGCMFTASVLFYFVIRFSKTNTKTENNAIIIFISIALSIVGWSSVMFLNAKWPWQLENALIMVAYMALGYVYRKYEDSIALELNSVKVIVSLSGIYILLFSIFDSSADIHKGIYAFPAVYIVMSLIAIPVLVAIAKRISNAEKAGEVLQLFGRNTLFLYAFENYAILVFFKICNNLRIDNAYILSSVCVVFSVVILIPIAELFNRYIPWAVGKNR